MLLIQNTQSFIELKQTFIFSSILLLIHTLGFWILNLLLPFIVCNLKALSTFSHTENTGMITLFEHYLIRLIQDRQLVMLNFPSSPSQTGTVCLFSPSVSCCWLFLLLFLTHCWVCPGGSSGVQSLTDDVQQWVPQSVLTLDTCSCHTWKSNVW